MANTQYWTGTSTFAPGLTPFGYYDNDLLFQSDCEQFAKYAALRMGFPVVGVELTAQNFYTAYEEAITEYANEVYRFKIKDNYINLEGSASGSAFNNVLTVPTLGNLIRISKTYGSEAGSGGLINYYSGSIAMIPGQQSYDLKAWAAISGSLAQGDSIEIKRIFNDGPPASARWYDSFQGTNTLDSGILEATGLSNQALPVTNNYLMQPVSSYDVTRFQAIEINDEIRRNAYSFEIRNNVLKIFPIPMYNTNIWFEYIKVSERDNAINPNSPIGVITDPSNVPYGNITYTGINAPGKQWIVQYALASAMSMLGMVRGKFATLEIPAAQAQLNGSSLESQAIAMKESLLESLREFLEATSRNSQLQKQQEQAELLKTTLSGVPLKIYVG